MRTRDVRREVLYEVENAWRIIVTSVNSLEMQSNLDSGEMHWDVLGDVIFSSLCKYSLTLTFFCLLIYR